MARRLPQELKAFAEINFWCPSCKQRWKAEPEPEHIHDEPETPWHPWSYTAICECGATAEQAAWERNLQKANHTLKEMPNFAHNDRLKNATPEEKARWRLHAITTGLYTKVVDYFPAKPGKYPHCERCEYLNNGCGDGDFYACAKRAEIFQRHRMAMETKDPSLLGTLRADLQSNLTAMMDDMILAVTRVGVQLKTPEWIVDPDGNIRLVQYVDEEGKLQTIYKYREHPLLARIFDAVQKNTLSLADMGLTHRSQEETDIMRGHLQIDAAQSESAIEYQRRSAAALENLQTLIIRSREKTKTDPILMEHQQAALEDDARSDAG